MQQNITVNKISDFGEKIGGARKDLFQDTIQLLSLITGDALISQPLSKLFPKPDFARMFTEEKITADTAIRLHFLYKSIPAKPRSHYYGSQRWADSVMPIINTIKLALQDQTILEGQPFLQKEDFFRFEKEYKAANWPEEAYNPSPYRIVHPEYYSTYSGFIVGKGNYIKFKSNDISECIAWIREQNGTNTGTGKKKADVRFVIRYFLKTGERFITPDNKKNVIVKRDFPDTESARAYITDHYDKLIEAYDKIRFVPEERNNWNRLRLGKDHRNGLDVSSEKFSQSFPFRGVEFGNWLNQVDRAASLNDGYDALMDLALALGIEPTALCLDAQLALAFGSRGKGGANAHYEPLKQVINLTKMKGAGSLAHEWFHAIDNYACIRIGSKLCFASDICNTQNENDLFLAFRNLRSKINSLPFKTRSEECDKFRSKPYWGTMLEMCARAFEKYIIGKLDGLGWHNDYLANIRSMADFGYDEKYPYPTDEENKALTPFFDRLVKAYFNLQSNIDLRKTA